MTFPLWYLLLPFALVLLGTAIFTFFNVYHVAKFGLQSGGTTLLVLLYIVGYLGVVAFSASLVSGYNWSDEAAAADLLPFGTGDNATFGL